VTAVDVLMVVAALAVVMAMFWLLVAGLRSERRIQPPSTRTPLWRLVLVGVGVYAVLALTAEAFDLTGTPTPFRLALIALVVVSWGGRLRRRFSRGGPQL